MYEFRWVYHNMKNGAPPQGSVFVGELYQKLQSRCSNDDFPATPMSWSEWTDVPHAGMEP